MEAKQLELFKETDFDRMKTFIKEYEGWYLFDNVRDRKDFSCRPSNRYSAVCSIRKTVFNIFGEDCTEARVAVSDKQAKLIWMSDYLKLAYSMRLNGNYIYNKKKCKLELKNGKG
jgi:hypothetical protein